MAAAVLRCWRLGPRPAGATGTGRPGFMTGWSAVAAARPRLAEGPSAYSQFRVRRASESPSPSLARRSLALSLSSDAAPYRRGGFDDRDGGSALGMLVAIMHGLLPRPSLCIGGSP